MITPDARRAVVKHWRESWKFSERQACKLARLPRNTNRYQKKPDENGALRRELRALAEKEAAEVPTHTTRVPSCDSTDAESITGLHERRGSRRKKASRAHDRR